MAFPLRVVGCTLRDQRTPRERYAGPTPGLAGVHNISCDRGQQVIDRSNAQYQVPPVQSIHFILNDSDVCAAEPSGQSLLAYLRSRTRLTGTKEGCNEGDCGACNVLVGTLVEGRVVYQPMPSCLVPVAELNRKHVVTVEGLGKQTTTVQTALVECGAVQCGFCIPGFVIALTGWLLSANKPLNDFGLNEALSGNLCRCTGYRSIRAAGRQLIKQSRTLADSTDRLAALCDNKTLPSYFRNVARRLAALSFIEPAPKHDAGITIAGGTDLYCQRRDHIADDPVNVIGGTSSIPPARVSEDRISVDARMTFESFGNDSLIQEAIPEIGEYNQLIASWPVRTRATLGGNIWNASPVADMACLLLALDAELELQSPKGSRWVALDEFYLGYKQLNAEAGEWLSVIRFPRPNGETRINWEKVSKRRTLDIASVNSAIRIESELGVVKHARLSVGGVAEIPMVFANTSTFLINKRINAETAWEAAEIAQSECSPISDVRGSSEYRRTLLRQLVLAHFLRLYPEQVKEEDIYAALQQ